MAGEARNMAFVAISLAGRASSLKDLPSLFPLIEEPPHHTERFEVFFRIPTFGRRDDFSTVDPTPDETPLVDDPAGDGRLATADDAEGSTVTLFENGPTWLLVEPYPEEPV